MSNRPRMLLIGMLVFTLFGVISAATSTYDYLAHLDRQVHAISCSVLPGTGSLDAKGTSGCFTVMMSPYAAVFRGGTWGGIPIALPGMAVFFYLLFQIGRVIWQKREGDRQELLYLTVAAFLPLLCSVVYYFISVNLVGTVCKLCMGIYLASIGGFVFSLLAFLVSPRQKTQTRGLEGEEPFFTNLRPGLPWGRYLGYFLEGVAFVLVSVLLYLGFKPTYTEELSNCGKLVKPEDSYGVKIKLLTQSNGVESLELLDPLCPACKGLHDRIAASGLSQRLDLAGVLFPLDKECNWMLSESVHPGSCLLSEAILCAANEAPKVIQWAFAAQSELTDLAKSNPSEFQRKVVQAFPGVAGCLGKPEVRSKLNKSLRWAVANALPVLTPQLFVRGKKICDEDTDLGLEYVLSRQLDSARTGSPAKAGGK